MVISLQPTSPQYSGENIIISSHIIGNLHYICQGKQNIICNIIEDILENCKTMNVYYELFNDLA